MLYSGATGGSYRKIALAGTLASLCSGFGVVSVAASNLQNGGPDGIALVDGSGITVQFLSYEGSFTAVDGPAAGLASADIGVSESGSGPATDSLQLGGTGTVYEDFSWRPLRRPALEAATPGSTAAGKGTYDRSLAVAFVIKPPAKVSQGDSTGTPS